ncbi:hypothetical protein HMPREF9442_01113 [Paraprevotella xylaniphila YIT 11841]|mgnify:CR=1|uniref:Uncharacterized protein n=1 Tax=Paraprevotella xylaniphila YIT 11841 TaxID=762982 RepID=F3QSF5_9BACT|nr:hypothetical protein HMPREF9442_01113 [Paraprevotella xylaniphila YIT 11841]
MPCSYEKIYAFFILSEGNFRLERRMQKSSTPECLLHSGVEHIHIRSL